MNTVLVVDDREMMRDSVSTTLGRAGFRVVTAEGAEAALNLVARRRPDAIVTDLKMPGISGIELVARIREIDDELPVVVMTAYGTVETAVQAIKAGAFDYITKPFEGDELIIAVKRAIGHAQVVRQNAVLRAQSGAATGESAGVGDNDANSARTLGVGRIIGESPAIRRVKEQILAIAESQGTVLIVGESGTGKEVVARAVHEASPRATHPLLAVNCAALSESLLESELFGHERGAFTGADRLRKGRFELADGGTLLLDEVSEVSPHIQAKLLRVLQERAFERVGSSLTIGVDVRVVATSNRDLPQAVYSGSFRQDLFFRLNVLPLHLPPLRDRLEDVPTLANHFVAQISQREGRSTAAFEEDALQLLSSYRWPGNVRELQNVCERAVVLSAARNRGAGDIRISRAMIEPWLSTNFAPTPAQTVGISIEPKASIGSSWSIPAGRTLDDLEREAIIQTLERFNGHRQKTAKALGIGVRTLGLKLKKWKEQHLVAETV